MRERPRAFGDVTLPAHPFRDQADISIPAHLSRPPGATTALAGMLRRRCNILNSQRSLMKRRAMTTHPGLDMLLTEGRAVEESHSANVRDA